MNNFTIIIPIYNESDSIFILVKEIKKESENIIGVAKDLIEVDGILSIFTGPGFLTITKDESSDWNMINNDILNKFDTI